jgi:hypothetical protein
MFGANGTANLLAPSPEVVGSAPIGIVSLLEGYLSELRAFRHREWKFRHFSTSS